MKVYQLKTNKEIQYIKQFLWYQPQKRSESLNNNSAKKTLEEKKANENIVQLRRRCNNSK